MGGRVLIVLDTHVLVWLDAGDARLGRKARRALDRALVREDIGVSAISFWEVEMLRRKGRLRMSQPADSWRRELLEGGLQEIAVDGELGIRAAALVDLNGDPADRLIVATALSVGTLVTADTKILDWDSDLERLDASN